MLNGILCIDKPDGHTSFDVVARMRGIARTKKIGHGGTLDPMATGVLPLFFGRAAKACDILPVQDKRYTAVFRLGVITDTQDITGSVLEQRSVQADAKQVEAALARFIGPQMQVPPMYSAVRVDGHRLYDLARQGIEVERPPRPVTFYSISLLAADEAAASYTIDVACSKGAYIRTLCHDVGQALGCGAALTALRRTEACGFSLSQCVTLEDARILAETGTLEQALLPVEQAFSTYSRLELEPRLAKLFCNGVPLWLSQFPDLNAADGEVLAVYTGDLFLGLARPHREQNQLKQYKLFHLEELP